MTRVRESKYNGPGQILAVVEWHKGWMEAYKAGRLLPADMPDGKSRMWAECLEYHMTIAERYWGQWEDFLKSETPKDGET